MTNCIASEHFFRYNDRNVYTILFIAEGVVLPLRAARHRQDNVASLRVAVGPVDRPAADARDPRAHPAAGVVPFPGRSPLRWVVGGHRRDPAAPPAAR